MLFKFIIFIHGTRSERANVFFVITYDRLQVKLRVRRAEFGFGVVGHEIVC